MNRTPSIIVTEYIETNAGSDQTYNNSYNNPPPQNSAATIFIWYYCGEKRLISMTSIGCFIPCQLRSDTVVMVGTVMDIFFLFSICRSIFWCTKLCYIKLYLYILLYRIWRIHQNCHRQDIFFLVHGVFRM